MKRFLYQTILCFLLSPFVLFANPWGKDADLAAPPPKSSSQYTLDAMKKYGFLKGFTMGCDRLMRENDDPWVYRKTVDSIGHPMKWDPVK
jgi:hypothetical protein